MTIQEKTRNYNDPTNMDTQDIKETLKNEAESAKKKGGALLENTAEEVKKYASDASSTLKHYVEKNPMTALGLAALTGLGIALLLSR